MLTQQLAIARREGRTFLQAWPDARTKALSVSSGGFDRAEWARVFADTTDEWRSAFERRQPTPEQNAIALLAETRRTSLTS